MGSFASLPVEALTQDDIVTAVEECNSELREYVPLIIVNGIDGRFLSSISISAAKDYLKRKFNVRSTVHFDLLIGLLSDAQKGYASTSISDAEAAAIQGTAFPSMDVTAGLTVSRSTPGRFSPTSRSGTPKRQVRSQPRNLEKVKYLLSSR